MTQYLKELGSLQANLAVLAEAVNTALGDE